MKSPASALLDQFGNALAPSRLDARASSATGAPYIPDGTWSYGLYDAVQYSQNRANRPFFAVDSRYTLNTWSRLRALALARWAYINVPYVRGAIDLMADLTVGTGFHPCSVGVADKGLRRAYDSFFTEKTRNIGFQSGESLDELLLFDNRCMDVDGDLGYLMTENGFGDAKIQLIESHRIKNGSATDPNLIDGVWVDRFARVQAYNVALPGDDATQRIEAKDFIYIGERNRPDEVRTMTALIHALNPLQDLYEVLGFAMQSAKKSAEYGAVIETATGELDDAPGLQPAYAQAVRAEQPASGLQPAQPAQMLMREQVFASGGKVPILGPGEKFNSFKNEQPGPNIQPWAEFIIRGIAVGYRLPFEVFWNPETIGGANTRMILGILRKRLEQRRQMLFRSKLNRVRFWLLCKEIKRGGLKWDPGILNCQWLPNFSDITVDAGRESRERRANVIAGLDTFTGYFSENGSTYETEIAVRENDVALQCAAARRLTAQYPGLSFDAALARLSLLTATAAEASATRNPNPPENP